jgi:hypothetical protein
MNVVADGAAGNASFVAFGAEQNSGMRAHRRNGPRYPTPVGFAPVLSATGERPRIGWTVVR